MCDKNQIEKSKGKGSGGLKEEQRSSQKILIRGFINEVNHLNRKI